MIKGASIYYVDALEWEEEEGGRGGGGRILGTL